MCVLANAVNARLYGAKSCVRVGLERKIRFGGTVNSYPVFPEVPVVASHMLRTTPGVSCNRIVLVFLVWWEAAHDDLHECSPTLQNVLGVHMSMNTSCNYRKHRNQELHQRKENFTPICPTLLLPVVRKQQDAGLRKLVEAT